MQPLLKIWLQKLLQKRSDDPQVISYQTLRKAVGWLGILLPFVLIIGARVLSGCRTIQPSISHYYYTNMREIFVGTLCGVSLFLFSYKGYSKLDSYVSNLAGFFCLSAALFPTTVRCITTIGFTSEDLCFPCQQKVISITNVPYHATIHFFSASLFFFTLAMMSIFLFRMSDKNEEDRTPQKQKRNIIFLVCGLVMLASIAAAGIYIAFFNEEGSTAVLWLETVALLAFGFSWLTKGEAILQDN